MDNQTTSALALCGIIVSGITTAIGIINHRRIRSSCCGKSLDASLDIESTTPPSKAIVTTQA
tara:strand:+ start:2241 stop:2426 length:186 start_codon:yes stop_codon:yes gene_type:complete